MKNPHLSILCLFFSLCINLSCLSSIYGQDNQRPEANPQPPKIIRKSSGILQKSAIRLVQPVYPALARAMGVSGPVVVEITLDEQGNVISARSLSGHPMLRDAAVEAAHQWTFTTITLSGVPVKVIGSITFNFTLDKLESIDKEIEYYKKLVSKNPHISGARHMMGQAYAKAKRFQEAIDAFQQAVTLDPNHSEAHYQLGYALLNQGRAEQAIEPFKKAIALYPSHSLAYQGLGKAHIAMGREKDAITELKQALLTDTYNTESHFLLGQIYFKIQQYEEAIKELKPTASYAQYQSNARLLMGLSYYKLGDKEAAMSEHKILEIIDKSAADHLMKAMNK